MAEPIFIPDPRSPVYIPDMARTIRFRVFEVDVT